VVGTRQLLNSILYIKCLQNQEEIRGEKFMISCVCSRAIRITQMLENLSLTLRDV